MRGIKARFVQLHEGALEPARLERFAHRSKVFWSKDGFVGVRISFWESSLGV